MIQPLLEENNTFSFSIETDTDNVQHKVIQLTN